MNKGLFFLRAISTNNFSAWAGSRKSPPASDSLEQERLISSPSARGCSTSISRTYSSSVKPLQLTTAGVRRLRRRPRNRAAWSSPLLESPMQLRMAFCSGILSIRGRGLPNRRSHITEPATMYPNPSRPRESSISQSLSNPGASPTGLSRFRSPRRTCSRLSLTNSPSPPMRRPRNGRRRKAQAS